MTKAAGMTDAGTVSGEARNGRTRTRWPPVTPAFRPTAVDARMRQLDRAGCEKMFRETASGARTHRARVAKALAVLDADDVPMVTRPDRVVRSTRGLLNIFGTIADSKAGFWSLGGTWADTTTAHGQSMLTVLGGLAESERELIRAHGRRPRTCQSPRREDGATTENDTASGQGSGQPPRRRRADARHRLIV